MEQLLLHLLGDYITQSDWMANNKTASSIPAIVHATVYSLPFLLLGPSWAALTVILLTHFLIDRFRLAKYVVWLKNFAYPWAYDPIFQGFIPDDKYQWENCKATGYPSETPVWLSVWLMIIADNTLHLGINFLSLKYL